MDEAWYDGDPTMPEEMPEAVDHILHGAGRLMDNPEYRRSTYAAIRAALIRAATPEER